MKITKLSTPVHYFLDSSPNAEDVMELENGSQFRRKHQKYLVLDNAVWREDAKWMRLIIAKKLEGEVK